MTKREQLLNDIRLAEDLLSSRKAELAAFDIALENNVFPTKFTALESMYDKLALRSESDIRGPVAGEEAYSQKFIVDNVVYEATLHVQYSSVCQKCYISALELFYTRLGSEDAPQLAMRIGTGNPLFNIRLKG